MENKLAFRNAPYFFVILVVLVFGIYGSFLGLAEDSDSISIYKNIEKLVNFEYIPSRSWGNPGYEFPISFIVYNFGLQIGNLYSLFWCLIFLITSYALLKHHKNKFWYFLAIALSPLTLSNASALMETMQGVSIAVLIVYFANQYLNTKNTKQLVFLTLLSVLLLLTRIDYVVLLFALWLSIVLTLQTNRERLYPTISFIIAGVVTALIYGLINNGYEFLSHNVLLSESYGRRAIRSIIGLVTIFSAPGLLLVATIVIINRQILINTFKESFLFKLLFFSLIFGGIRFMLLPDELEYIFWLLPIIIFGLSSLNIPKYLAVPLAISIASVSFVNISFFDRNLVDDNLKFAPKVSIGGVFQDFASRKMALIRNESMFSDYLNQSLSKQYPECGYYDIKSSNNDCLIVDFSIAYQVDNPRIGVLTSDKYKKVLVSENPIFGWRGWRVSQPSINYSKTFNDYKNKKQINFIELKNLKQ